MNVDLSTFNNQHYNPGGNLLKRVLWYITNIVYFKSSWINSSAWKRFLLRLFGAEVGKGIVIKPSVNIKYPWHLTIGDYVWIGENVWIDNLDDVVIEDHVCISQGAMLLCGNHNYKLSSFDLITGPIHLEAGAWIGAKTVIGPGTRIGSHAVISVGSVATGNLDGWKIYRGNPAVFVKERIISE